MNKPVFLNYDQAELDRQYDNLAYVPNALELIKDGHRKSDEAHAQFPARTDLRYDPAPRALLDLFMPDGPGPHPVVIYIHGGQWQKQSKEDSGFPASSLIPAGVGLAVIGFDLIPQVDLDEMVRQVRTAVLFLHRHAADLNIDAQRMVLLGHSSGGHLAAMVAVTDWHAFAGEKLSPIAATMVVSGMYDLEPVMLSFRREYLKLDRAGTERNSPIRFVDRLTGPVVAVAGEGETDEFRRHGKEFANVCAARVPAEYLEIAGANHYEVITTLADPTTPLSRRLIDLVASTG